MHSVAITGMAAVLGKLKFSLPSSYPFPVHLKEELDYGEILGKRGLQYLTDATKMALTASKLAWEDAQLGEIVPERGGVVLATNMASINHTTQFDRKSLEDGVDYVSPMQGPNLLLNAPASRLGIAHKLTGFNTTISSGRVASLDALEYAVYAIERGEVDLCIVGGVEELSEEYQNWFFANEFIDHTMKDLLNEGACIVILESLEHAAKRNAKIYGKLKGFSSLFDSDALCNVNKRNFSAETAQLLIDTMLERSGIELSSIGEVCLPDNILGKPSQDEKNWFTEFFSEDVNLLDHFTDAGELYGASGMMQLMKTIQSDKKSLSYITNEDWFGNYHSVLIEKG